MVRLNPRRTNSQDNTMARIPYVTTENATPEQSAHLEKLQSVRGRASNIFLALANEPALSEGVLAMATSLRKSTLLSRRLRELAVVAVGIETGSDYELLHHWKIALDLGITQSELEAVAAYRNAACFTALERDVIGFALDLTRAGTVSQVGWDAVEPLGASARMELLLTVAWYNCVARMARGLDLDIEPWFDPPVVPDLAFPYRTTHSGG